jgi:hypothetical protein
MNKEKTFYIGGRDSLELIIKVTRKEIIEPIILDKNLFKLE